MKRYSTISAITAVVCILLLISSIKNVPANENTNKAADAPNTAIDAVKNTVWYSY